MRSQLSVYLLISCLSLSSHTGCDSDPKADPEVTGGQEPSPTGGAPSDQGGTTSPVAGEEPSAPQEVRLLKRTGWSLVRSMLGKPQRGLSALS